MFDCPNPLKVKYWSRKKALHRLRRVPHWKADGLRPYRCPSDWEHWHLGHGGGRINVCERWVGTPQ